MKIVIGRSLVLLCVWFFDLGTGYSQNQPQLEPEAYSLFGQPLYPLVLPEAEKAKLDSNLARAQAEYDRNPRDPERIIWLGRRLALYDLAPPRARGGGGQSSCIHPCPDEYSRKFCLSQ